MNKKGIKKILFIFLLVIGMFFINSEVVKADGLVCQYKGAWGSLDIYSGTVCEDSECTSTKTVYTYKHVKADCNLRDKPCYEIEMEHSFMGEVFSTATKSFKDGCPILYYKTDVKKQVTLDPTTDTTYDAITYELTFSYDKIGENQVTSSIGTTQLSQAEKECNNLKSQLNNIRSKYQGGNSTSSSSIVSRVNALEKGAVNLKGQPELYESLKNEVETLTSLLSDIKINHYNKIDTVKLNNNCDEAGKSLYKTVGNEIETLARRVASYGYTIENTL